MVEIETASRCVPKSLILENLNFTFDQYKNMDINDKQILEFHMMNACTEGQLEVISEYLQVRNINDLIYNEWTPLLYAACSSQTKVIEYLISNGADVNKHKDGYTPLMALCNSQKNTVEQRIQCLRLLLKAGAQADACNKQRQTPLMFACALQESEFVTELIKHVKNINACDNRKQTALMYATIANKPDIVKILIENTVDVTLTDYNDLTANDIASMKQYHKILSLLNFEEEETINTYEVAKINNWRDMYPSLANINDHCVDFDIFTILHGMHLEQYAHLFQGMNLITFLQLTESDLCDLGVDINVHRIQFIEHLHIFHRKKWSVQSIGAINRSLSYTLYDGIVCLGKVAKQIAVIGSSFQYIKNNLIEPNDKNVYLSEKQLSNYEQELKNTKKCLSILEKELLKVKVLSKKIQKDNDIGMPAIYIRPRRHRINWPVYISISLIVGIYVSKIMYAKKLIHF